MDRGRRRPGRNPGGRHRAPGPRPPHAVDRGRPGDAGAGRAGARGARARPGRRLRPEPGAARGALASCATCRAASTGRTATGATCRRGRARRAGSWRWWCSSTPRETGGDPEGFTGGVLRLYPERPVTAHRHRAAGRDARGVSRHHAARGDARRRRDARRGRGLVLLSRTPGSSDRPRTKPATRAPRSASPRARGSPPARRRLRGQNRQQAIAAVRRVEVADARARRATVAGADTESGSSVSATRTISAPRRKKSVRPSRAPSRVRAAGARHANAPARRPRLHEHVGLPELVGHVGEPAVRRATSGRRTR